MKYDLSAAYAFPVRNCYLLSQSNLSVNKTDWECVHGWLRLDIGKPLAASAATCDKRAGCN